MYLSSKQFLTISLNVINDLIYQIKIIRCSFVEMMCFMWIKLTTSLTKPDKVDFKSYELYYIKNTKYMKQLMTPANLVV